jgi:hypothetical protein
MPRVPPVAPCSPRLRPRGPRRNQCGHSVAPGHPKPGYAVAWIDHSDTAVVGKTRDGGATWALTLTDVGVGYPSDVFFI